MNNQGWIKIHRKLLDWEWWDEPTTLWLFIKCLIYANHIDNKWKGIEIKKGSFITSYGNLASKKAHISVQQVRTSLNRLKSTGEITIKTTNKYTIVTVCHWNTYQSDNTQNNKQITNKQQTNNKQITTNNNDKNDNNNKNEKKYPSLKSIDDFTLQEVADKYKVSLSFVRSKLDDMTNWLEAKGKKYKNYKSALMNWVKSDALKILEKERQRSQKFQVKDI